MTQLLKMAHRIVVDLAVKNGEFPQLCQLTYMTQLLKVAHRIGVDLAVKNGEFPQ